MSNATLPPAARAIRIAFFSAAAVTRLGEVRAGDDDGAGRANEVLVDVRFRKRHVGAVLAVEEERERPVVLDREDGERRQPLGIDLDAVERHALAGELLADEASELLVADRVIRPAFSPSRAAPIAMLVGEPPTDFAKLETSSRREPICCP